jgi:hypothetical protein
VCDEVGAGLGQPVEQRHELSKRTGGVAQAVGLENADLAVDDPLKLSC